jgi:hypothetical protein
MLNANAKVGENGAKVLDWNYEATGETLPAETPVQTGLMFQGAWDADGKPVGEQYTYIEVALEDGREVWVNAQDLVELTAA